MRRGLAYGAAVLLVLAAMLVGLANQFLPLLERHPDRIAAWLSERVGQPVAFDRVNAFWTRRGPLLGLERLRVGEGAQAIEIGSAQLLVSVYSGLMPGRPLTELRVDAVSLDLLRGEDGRWQVRGLADAPRSADGDPLAVLDGFGEIHVRGAALRVRAPDLDIDMTVPRLDLRLRSGGGRTRAGLEGWTGGGPPVSAVFDIDRARGDGTLYLAGQAVDLEAWSPVLGLSGVRVTGGTGRLQVWAQIAGQRVASVRAEAEFRNVRFEGERPIPGAEGDEALLPRFELERLSAGLGWWAQPGGWRLQAPLLRFQAHDQTQVLDGLHLEGGDRVVVLAERIEAGPLLALAALSDRLPDGIRRWLHLARPTADISGLAYHGHGDLARGRARLAGLGWRPVDTVPAFVGLGGDLLLDGEGMRLQLDPSQVRFDWPPNLVASLEMALLGELQAWRDDGDWRIGTDGLRVRGEDYGFDVRGWVAPGERGRPRVDLAVEVAPGPVTAAHRFWILGHMPPTAVEWLEEAIEEGHLASGRLVVAGDLADWPFRDGEGVFDATADLEGLGVRYRDDWPPARRVAGQARFGATGFSFDAREGAVGGVALRGARAVLEDYSQPLLRIDAEGEGSGELLRALLLDSPLRQRHGEHLEALGIGGRGRVALGLHIPLKAELGAFRMDGTVDLADARLTDPRWDIDFSRATGRIRFSERGFSAEELSVVMDGQLGSLSLAAGAFTSDAALAFEASLRGRFDVDSLLTRQEGLAWLSDWLSGRTDWSIGLRIPQGPGGDVGVPRLFVASSLEGATLSAPAPLRKGAEDSLPLAVSLALPLDAGPLEVDLGQLMRLRGRVTPGGGLDGSLDFGPVAEPVDVGPGLHVRGQMPALDVAGWVAFAMRAPSDGSADAGAGFQLGSVDITAGQLDVLDNAFVDTRLRVWPRPGHWQVEVEGAELAGEVRVPLDLEEGIEGRFSRVHWPSGRAARGDSFDADPATVPALRLVIDDLNFGDARLGRARLETYPAQEGLHVRRFETTSDTQRIRATGHWARIDGRAYSRFAVDFNADSLGRMLDAFGYAGMVEGGRTEARLEAGWVGSPAAFSLERVEGSLRVDVGQGRILEVEPGAGRLLGLVSLAELPRRLILDFSDFFGQGFSFNSIQGEFVLGGGQARTEDLAISGPAADIRVRGRAGLQARDYDQTLEVLPKTGGVLPVLGAVTGGPAGAAIGAVAQAILNRPMKEMSRTLYRVTGPWQAPQVEVLERGPAREGGSGGGNAR